jgi:ribose transport system substrate-binding protein
MEEEHMNELKGARLVAVLAVIGIVGACGGGGGTGGSAAPSTGASAAPSTAASAEPSTGGEPSGGTGGSYHIGVSNTVQGNGWREEMICSIRAQAAASGEVAKVTEAHRNTDAAGQLEDIRNLIAADVDAIIVNPAGPDAVNAALQEAIDAGIVVVAVDQAVTQEGAYLMANNQEEYGYLGASWLFEQLGGEGDVLYMRGAAGATADDDRDRGFQRALEENPGINVVHEVHTGWDPVQGAQQFNDFIATGQNFDGVWTSGIDVAIVEAMKAAGGEYVPVVGADNAGFVQALLDEEGFEGLTGAAVTNPASVGGAGVTLALQILNGEAPDEPNQLVNPEVWDDVSEEGRAKLEEANDPDIDPSWPLGITIPDWTTYEKADILACEAVG